MVNALEARSGWTARSRFASVVRHAIIGHVPYARYRQAGLVRKRENARAGEVEKLVFDWLATDLNPAVQLIQNLKNVTSVIEAFNAYNSSVQLGVRTNASLDHQIGQTDLVIKVSREKLSTDSDPEACKIGTIIVLNALAKGIKTSQSTALPTERAGLFSVAHSLGLAWTPVGESCEVLEREGNISISDLARRLGCHQRTLERRFRESGLTPELLRQASRLIQANARLGSCESLTNIAMEVGFSDLSHMTRAFKNSCGMTPSLCRSLIWSDLHRGSAISI